MMEWVSNLLERSNQKVSAQYDATNPMLHCGHRELMAMSSEEFSAKLSTLYQSQNALP